MPRTLFIHIGAPKTGSTALQMALTAARDDLQKSGLLYPEGAARAGGHHDLAFLLHGGYPHWAIPQNRSLDELWEALEGDVARHQGDVLLSSENFFLYPAPGELAERLRDSRVFRDFTVKIIVYLRPQEKALPSWYNQAVKAQGASATFPEFIHKNEMLWDYDAALTPWAETFGARGMVVRVYAPSRDWDIFDDFRALLPGSPALKGGEQPRTNTRLNRDLLEFQRIINRLPVPTVKKRKFHKQLIALTAQARGSSLFNDTPLLGGTEMESIRARYQPSNNRVAQKYLGQKTLFSNEPYEPTSPPLYPGLGMETVVEVLGWLLINDQGTGQ